ncbi:AAA family ATPase [Candidatus Merdisoma sp. JLR.KK006]|uniref:AAA family ATPase n=1 Tax=Candidatus Merdisoma sp. JLR.KK006 TaxID=3112626 RepID=UPI002FF334B0
MTKKLPIGIENFETMRKEGFYYIDKTGLIRDLLKNWAQVNLFTRPRRFGKSLNMNMLKYFFEYGCDSSLFDGLAIGEEKGLCQEYMGKFPVISISLKDADAMNYEGAREMLCSIIGCEALRFSFLSESEQLSELEKSQYKQLVQVDTSGAQHFIMSDGVLGSSLFTLTQLLRKHYGQKVILLIDEYDVPLDKAQHFGYYDEMVAMIRKMFSHSLKTNDNLLFAVLTGCLRIAKESIFTGLNNLKVLTITDVRFDEYFGLLDWEVQEMLRFYGLEDKYELIKEWYDGYRFGNSDVYCPWDVINYVDLLRADPSASPKAYWINSSGNDIIRRFLKMAKGGVRREIEKLIEGGTVVKKLNEELTYRDMYNSIDNLWSVLFTTGYLTKCGEEEGDRAYGLTIPNLEIRQIFIEQVMEWIQEEVRKDTPKLDEFCDAFLKGETETIEALFTAFLKKTISIRDTSVRKEKKENFYHGVLLGLLSHREEWDIRSNAESGDRFSDILIEIEDDEIGIVIEVKYPDKSSLETGCREALEQIEKKGYEERLLEDGMTAILKYGIACERKRCMVRSCCQSLSQ